VRIKIQRIIDEEDSKILIIEIPLLFESRLEKCFDLILNVFSEEAIQVKRLITRNDISEQEALKKIRNQMPGLEKYNKADINIINNTSKGYLFKQLYEIEEKFIKLKFRDIQRLTNH
ncbi:MAG: dephospho-CoA kinase, partial [Candidatus Cloacimonetes bacterium]|nr:dephospho-CoA kinase [Candidatus Cloacimonadota bacterium]